eukprot:480725-Pyramimonas_sp.AAC.1
MLRGGGLSIRPPMRSILAELGTQWTWMCAAPLGSACIQIYCQLRSSGVAPQAEDQDKSPPRKYASRVAAAT